MLLVGAQAVLAQAYTINAGTIPIDDTGVASQQ
jgi:hypothetical protein